RARAPDRRPARYPRRSGQCAAYGVHADRQGPSVRGGGGKARHADRSNDRRGGGAAFRVVLCDAQIDRGACEGRHEQQLAAARKAVSAVIATPTVALAEFAAALKLGDLPADVVANVKLMILDSLGCAIAATTLGDGCRETMAVMRSLGGTPES